MKKAIIATGGHQYLVSEGETIEVELIGGDKTTSFEPLLVIDGDSITVGSPIVPKIKVSAEILGNIKAEKVTAIRYKAKKRVKKVRGHRQQLTQIKIGKIA